MLKPLLRLFLLTCALPLSLTRAWAANPPNLTAPPNNSTTSAFAVNLGVSNQAGHYFEFRYDTSNMFTSPHFRSDTSSTTIFRTGQLLKGKKYFWQARAISNNTLDTSGWSGSFAFTVFTKPSNNAPVNGSATAALGPVNAATAANFVNGVIYIFEFDTVATFNSSKFVRKSVNSVTSMDSTLFGFGRKIFWRTAHVNSFGDTTSWSDVWNFTIRKKPILTGPIQNNVDPKHPIFWNNSGAADVLVQLDTVPQFNSAFMKLINGTLTKSSDSLANMFFGKKHYWRIREIFKGDSTSWSDSGIYTVKLLPATLLPANNEPSAVLAPNFTWTAMKGVSFRYQLSTDSTFATLLKDTLIPGSTALYNYPAFLKIKTKYYWRIKAIHSTDSTNWVSPRFTTGAGKPVLKGPSGADQNIELIFKWDPVPGASDFKIELDTVPAFNSSALYTRMSNKIGGNPVSMADTIKHLYYGKTHYWRVIPYFGTDTGAVSNVSSFSTKNKVKMLLPAFGQLELPTQVIPEVEGVPGSDAFYWEVDTTSTFNSPEFRSGTSAHVYDSATASYPVKICDSLLFGTRYWWRARSINAIDHSLWSDLSYFTTTDKVETVAPGHAETNLPPFVYLSWYVQGKATDYIYQYQLSKDSTFTGAAIQTLPPLQLMQAKVKADYSSTYFWRVRATHARDQSEWSVPAKFSTIVPPPVDAPKLNLPYNGTVNVDYTKDLLVFWYPVDSIDTYEIMTATNSSFTNDVKLYNATGYKTAITGFDPNTTYYWRARAVRDSFNSAWSDHWMFITKDKPASVKELADKGISFFPNPASKTLNITQTSATISTIAVFSPDGKKVVNEQQIGAKYQLDLSELAAGIYIVQLKTVNGEQLFFKFVKE